MEGRSWWRSGRGDGGQLASGHLLSARRDIILQSPFQSCLFSSPLPQAKTFPAPVESPASLASRSKQSLLLLRPGHDASRAKSDVDTCHVPVPRPGEGARPGSFAILMRRGGGGSPRGGDLPKKAPWHASLSSRNQCNAFLPHNTYILFTMTESDNHARHFDPSLCRVSSEVPGEEGEGAHRSLEDAWQCGRRDDEVRKGEQRAP